MTFNVGDKVRVKREYDERYLVRDSLLSLLQTAKQREELAQSINLYPDLTGTVVSTEAVVVHPLKGGPVRAILIDTADGRRDVPYAPDELELVQSFADCDVISELGVSK